MYLLRAERMVSYEILFICSTYIVRYNNNKKVYNIITNSVGGTNQNLSHKGEIFFLFPVLVASNDDM